MGDPCIYTHPGEALEHILVKHLLLLSRKEQDIDLLYDVFKEMLWLFDKSLCLFKLFMIMWGGNIHNLVLAL